MLISWAKARPIRPIRKQPPITKNLCLVMVLKCRHAFIELLKEKSFQEITVRELSERADINRKTFYAYYTGMEELLAAVMDEMLEKYRTGLRKISFRAIAPYRVSHIAAMLGGGGHVLAAGCRTEMSQKEAAELIEREMCQQIEELKYWAKEYGFKNSQVFIFYKNYSAQVLKANMRAVGNFETAILFYRDKLPKFRNNGRMEFLCQPWIEDRETPKVHPTQKPVPLLEHLISLYTDIDDVVIDCCAGSGTTLLACANLERRAYGFELKREFVNAFYDKILPCKKTDMFILAEKEDLKRKQMELWGA